MSNAEYFISKIIALSVLALVFWGCGNDDISQSFSASEANRLLSKGAIKVWALVDRSENGTKVDNGCTTNRTLTFVMAATDSLYLLGKSVNCTDTDVIDTLYKADYEVLSSNDNFSDSLSLTNEKFAAIGIMRVNELTSQILRISYTENGVKVIERYGD